MRKSIRFTVVSIFVLLLTTFIFVSGCNLNDLENRKQVTNEDSGEGRVEFGLGGATSKAITYAEAVAQAREFIVSIEDSSGNRVYDNKVLPVYNFNGYPVTAPISLVAGDYQLVQFLVRDTDGNVILAAPQEGSPFASFVNDPLPIAISIQADQVTKVVPEVLSTEDCEPKDFGYATFSFDLINISAFYIAAFEYNSNSENFELTDAVLRVEAEGNIIYSGELLAVTNRVYIENIYERYHLIVEKDGAVWEKWFTRDELFLECDEDNPIIATLNQDSPNVYRVPVERETGGVFTHPDGISVHITENALSENTELVISRQTVVPVIGTDGSVDLSRSYEISIGQAYAQGPIYIEFPYPRELAATENFDPENILLSHGDGAGQSWLRPVNEINRDKQSVLSRTIQDQLNNKKSPSVRTFLIKYIAPLLLFEPTPVLQVPYYWQDFLPWCVPTSLSMVLNYHDGGLAGIVSNWYLAGNHSQDEGSGAWGNQVMDSNGASSSDYKYYKWDADSIPNGAFTSYIKRITQGYNLQDILGPVINLGFITIQVPDVDIPARPAQLSSTTTWHAFTAVGTSDSSIWLHDSSGAFTGSASIATEQSWATFRSIAIDQAESDELHTLVVNYPVRPENERRGSIELSEGSSSGYIRFENANGGVLSNWEWDGDPYNNGYYWSDPTNVLTNNSAYGNLISLLYADTLEYSLRVDNVTQFDRDYSLTVQIRNGSGTVLETNNHDVTVASYTRGAYITDEFDLSSVFLYQSPGQYSISFWLYQDGVLNDAKSARFRTESVILY